MTLSSREIEIANEKISNIDVPTYITLFSDEVFENVLNVAKALNFDDAQKDTLSQLIALGILKVFSRERIMMSLTRELNLSQIEAEETIKTTETLIDIQFDTATEA